MKTLKFMLALVLAVGLSAQTLKPAKSRLDGTRGTVTLKAIPEIDAMGHWNTRLYLSSPNTPTFMICLRYLDGTGAAQTTRTIFKTATAYGDNEAEILLPLPIEVVESGGLIVYEMAPLKETGFGNN